MIERVSNVRVILRGCRKSLTTKRGNLNGLRTILDQIVDLIGAVTLDESYHIFSNKSYTICRILSVSHLVISSYPEFNIVICDLATCSDLNKNKVKSITSLLKTFFRSRDVTVNDDVICFNGDK